MYKMKLRNGEQIKPIIEVFFPEDVWEIIKKEYLDIDNSWKKCFNKYKLKYEPMQNEYVNVMLARFSNDCYRILDAAPVGVYPKNERFLHKKFAAYYNLYESVIKNIQILEMKRESILNQRWRTPGEYRQGKSGRLISVLKMKNISLEYEIKERLGKIVEDRDRNIYVSVRNEKMLKKLHLKIRQVAEEINYYNL